MSVSVSVCVCVCVGVRGGGRGGVGVGSILTTISACLGRYHQEKTTRNTTAIALEFDQCNCGCHARTGF